MGACKQRLTSEFGVANDCSPPAVKIDKRMPDPKETHILSLGERSGAASGSTAERSVALAPPFLKDSVGAWTIE